MAASRKKRKTKPVRKTRAEVKAETRAGLLSAAAKEFIAKGYFGTDTNTIARAGGFAPATFYLHFKDKLEIFIAVHEEQASGEWPLLEQMWRDLAEGTSRRDAAAAFVRSLLRERRRVTALRASREMLRHMEPSVQNMIHDRQNALVRGTQELSVKYGLPRPDPREIGLYVLTFNAYANQLLMGEPKALGLSSEMLTERLIDQLAQILPEPLSRPKR